MSDIVGMSPPRLGAPEAFHRQFERWVDRTPDACAVTHAGQSLSYLELDRRANRLAHVLIDAGVERGTLVGLCVSRSLDIAVGILGILKAGATYVPLDPSYPADHLRDIATRSGLTVVVGTEATLATAGIPTPRAIFLEDRRVAGAPDGAPRVPVGPDDLAYVIFTSGSTGAPKGVMMAHGNLTRLMPSVAGHFDFRPDDTWSMVHSYAFGFGVWEMWGAWQNGARVLIAPSGVREADALYEIIAAERVTVLSATTSAFRLLCLADEGARSPGPLPLRYVIFSGEPLDVDAMRSWFRRHGADRPVIANMYGSTETGKVAFRRVTPRQVGEGSLNLIGRPLPDVTVRVVDEDGRPVAPGETGEIYAGGASVAQGYLGEPVLTEDRFVPDPFGEDLGTRFYRTGDLARYTATGELEFQGRKDNQVKIRGHRVDPATVHAVLATHPAVDEAVVAARAVEDRGRRLVAYVVPVRTSAAAPAVNAEPGALELWPCAADTDPERTAHGLTSAGAFDGTSEIRLAAISLPAALRNRPSATPDARRRLARTLSLRETPPELLVYLRNVGAGHVASTSAVVSDRSPAGALRLTLQADGVIDGLVLESARASLFFPTFAPGLHVHGGDEIHVDVDSAVDATTLARRYSLRGEVRRRHLGARAFACGSHHSLDPEGRSAFVQQLLAPPAAVDDAPRAIQDYLRQRLPEYMVPEAVVEIDRIPRRPNGKVDYGALPDAPAGRPDTGTEYVAPRFESERIICGLYAELLGMDGVGARDHFFELGGYSLLAMQAAARLMVRFGVDVAVRDLFDAPTPAELAVLLLERMDAAATS
jgi:amino acid adenylation domain-containing protein